MSHRPRRTVEMGEGSQSKPARTSRIAQPIRRPSMRERSLERTSSMDRLPVGSLLTASGMKLKKSTSYATPMRTPMRTPSRSIIPRQDLISTCEKEKQPSDKKWIQTQAAKISEYLHSIEFELGVDFSTKFSLKSMSTKQFIVIVNHFVKKVVSNRLSVGTNYIEDIAKILAQIGYPYTVNKSWLKTPTAPHAFNNVVTLLSWFLQFVSPKDSLYELKEYLLPGTDFPDKNFAHLFMQRAEEGFILWNNSKDEDLQALRKNLLDEFIVRQTCIQGMDAMEKELVSINSELDKLYQNRIVIKREDEFLQLGKKIKIKEKLLVKLKESCSNNAKQLSKLNELAVSKNKVLDDIKQRISDLHQIIQTQEMSIEDRDKLIVQVSYLKQCVESKKKLISQLQDMGSANQVQLSRLIRQKIEVISKFNNYLYQIFSEKDSNFSINIKDYCLDQNSDENLEEQLNRVLPLLLEISQRNLEDYRRYSAKISELESQLKMACYTHDTVLERNLSDLINRCAELEQHVEDVNMQIINEEGDGAKQMEDLIVSLAELVEMKKQIMERITTKQEELLITRNENVAMLARIMEKGGEFLTEKEIVVRKECEAIDSFRRTLEDVTLKLKDIP